MGERRNKLSAAVTDLTENYSAQMVKAAKECAWSSYRATTGIVACPEWLDREWVLLSFSRRQKTAIERFEKFVLECKNQPSPWEDLKNQKFLSGENFVDRMLTLVDAEKDLSEIPQAQRRVVGKSIEEYVRSSSSRNEAIVSAYRSGNYTLAGIGKHFDLHFSTVGGIVRNYSK